MDKRYKEAPVSDNEENKQEETLTEVLKRVDKLFGMDYLKELSPLAKRVNKMTDAELATAINDVETTKELGHLFAAGVRSASKVLLIIRRRDKIWLG